MNRNFLFGLLAAAAVFLLLAAVFWLLFEIVPRTKHLPPSREARVNEYLALDRWLSEEGIPVRTESSGDLSTVSGAEEKRIFIQASLFRWTDEAAEYLISWVEEGGHLFLVLDNREDPEPLSLLEEFGITIDAGTALPGYHYDPEAPGFDRDASFEIPDEIVQNEEAFALKDRTGLSRLVQVRRGGGKLTVSGKPRFLLSPNLGDAPNARLAWALFASDGGLLSSGAGSREGWLFIRGTTRDRGLLGSLFRQGNLPVLLMSLLVLLVIGFWTLIPMFGLVRSDNDKPGKSLAERFLAEGRFLKRYGALGLYRDAYVKEIRRRMRQEGLSTGEETEKRLLATWGKPDRDSRLLVRVLRGEPFKYREFHRIIMIFKTILERI